MRSLLWLVVIAVGAAGCQSDAVMCMAGQSAPCACANGGVGEQPCLDDGAFGPCACGPAAPYMRYMPQSERLIEPALDGMPADARVLAVRDYVDAEYSAPADTLFYSSGTPNSLLAHDLRTGRERRLLWAPYVPTGFCVGRQGTYAVVSARDLLAKVDVTSEVVTNVPMNISPYRHLTCLSEDTVLLGGSQLVRFPNGAASKLGPFPPPTFTGTLSAVERHGSPDSLYLLTSQGEIARVSSQQPPITRAEPPSACPGYLRLSADERALFVGGRVLHSSTSADQDLTLAATLEGPGCVVAAADNGAQIVVARVPMPSKGNDTQLVTYDRTSYAQVAARPLPRPSSATVARLRKLWFRAEGRRLLALVRYGTQTASYDALIEVNVAGP